MVKRQGIPRIVAYCILHFIVIILISPGYVVIHLCPGYSMTTDKEQPVAKVVHMNLLERAPKIQKQSQHLMLMLNYQHPYRYICLYSVGILVFHLIS